LDCRSFIKEPESASLVDFRIEFTTNVKTYDGVIGFDAIVAADIELCDTVRGSDRSDDVTQWFRVPVQVKFEESVELSRVHGDVEIYSRINYDKTENAARAASSLSFTARTTTRKRHGF
jgi:hypothetical protein